MSKEIEVVEKVELEPAAYVLRVMTPQGEVTEEISWNTLRSAEIGAKWESVGGGNLYSDRQAATLVYRDDEKAALFVESDYADDSRSEHYKKLVAFAFKNES